MERLTELLDGLLHELALNAPDFYTRTGTLALFSDFAFTRVNDILNSGDLNYEMRRFETRLRLALHLSPRIAICYDRRSSIPRWEYIAEYLQSEFQKDAQFSERVARQVSLVLDSWDETRRHIPNKASYFFDDGRQCAHCRVSFEGKSKTLEARDEFKPYYLSPDELLSPEIDHKDAISRLGSNAPENLHVLCRLCNFGKGDGLGISARMEAKFSGLEITEVETLHRCRLVYNVIRRDRSQCTKCGTRDLELTIRLLRKSGGLLLSNLATYCVKCITRAKS